MIGVGETIHHRVRHLQRIRDLQDETGGFTAFIPWTFQHENTELARQGKLDPVIGREREIERAIQILCRRTKNNPVLLGEAGVGKTAIVEGFAQRVVDGNVPELLADRRIVVLDLVGRGHDGNALMAAARAAFGPDNPGVSIGPVGRFGTMELSLPRRARPLAEVLCREDGRLSDRTLAQRLVRRLRNTASVASDMSASV